MGAEAAECLLVILERRFDARRVSLAAVEQLHFNGAPHRGECVLDHETRVRVLRRGVVGTTVGPALLWLRASSPPPGAASPS